MIKNEVPQAIKYRPVFVNFITLGDMRMPTEDNIGSSINECTSNPDLIWRWTGDILITPVE